MQHKQTTNRKNNPRFYPILPDFTRFYPILPDFTRFYPIKLLSLFSFSFFLVNSVFSQAGYVRYNYRQRF
jgi:hypothetical protein